MARVPSIPETELTADQRRLLGFYEELGEEFTPHVENPTAEYLASREEGTPRLYQALVHNPPIFESFRQLSSTLRADCGLDERERELVILTTARETDAEYEWYQHVRIGLAGDLTPEEIRAIGSGRDGPFDERERALVAYVSQFVSRSVDDDTHGALADYFDPDTVVGVAMLTQFYLGLAHVIDALDIELDGEFVGWELVHLE